MPRLDPPPPAASLVCLLPGPRLCQNATTDETFGSPVVVTINAVNIPLGFQVVGGNDTLPFFKINSCSGQLSVVTPGLSARTQPFFRLLIEARSNNDAALSTRGNVTVVVMRAPKPPVFNDTSYIRAVFENTTVGALLQPCIVASDPDNEPISFSVADYLSSNGAVNVTAAGTERSRPQHAAVTPTPRRGDMRDALWLARALMLRPCMPSVVGVSYRLLRCVRGLGL